MEWQPIETAPIEPHEQATWFRDKSPRLLLCGGGRPWVYIGSFSYTERGKGRWKCEALDRNVNPTHWMPLPAPPTNSSPANVSPASRSVVADEQREVPVLTEAQTEFHRRTRESGMFGVGAASVGEPAQLLTEAELDAIANAIGVASFENGTVYEADIQRAVLKKNIGRDLSRVEE